MDADNPGAVIYPLVLSHHDRDAVLIHPRLLRMPYPPTARSRNSLATSDVLSISSLGTEYSIGLELYTCTSPASDLSCAQQSSQLFPETPRTMDFPDSPSTTDFRLSPVLEDHSPTDLSPLLPQFTLPTSVPSSVTISRRADGHPPLGPSRVPKIGRALSVPRRRAHTVDSAAAAPKDAPGDAQPEIRIVTWGTYDLPSN
ncbi:hypothetical protein HMN09_00786800 [Mycena chlorophos]|uniref:Uncharacterized protein n=1 Tax=Mycena chlorophos TaxID=658473 RepID=A0A8H6WAK0_MYCCL|nr:hypothetical protein HMN09_00786800 [Mycena chlorophos]